MTIKNENIDIVLSIKKNKNKYIADIKTFYLNKYSFQLSGRLDIDLDKGEFSHTGGYNLFGVNGGARIDFKDFIVNYSLYSNEFESLEFLKEIATLSEELQTWLFNNIKVTKYKIDSLQGEIDFNKKELDFSNVKGVLKLTEPKVEFDPKLDKVISKSGVINLKDEKLDIELEEPKYLGIVLQNTKLMIDHLFHGKSDLNLDFTIKSKIGPQIKRILSAYDIDLPIVQKSSFSTADISLDIGLDDDHVDVKAKVTAHNTYILIEGIGVKFDDLSVDVTNDKIKIFSKTFYFKDKLRAGTKLTLDTNTMKMDGKLNIKKFLLTTQSGRVLANVNQQSTDIEVDLNDNLIAFLKKYNIYFDVTKELVKIYINDFKLVKYSAPMLSLFKVNNGNMIIKTKDFDIIDATIFAKEIGFPIYAKDGKRITGMEFLLHDEPAFTSIKSTDGLVDINVGNYTEAKIKNIDFNVEEYLDNEKKTLSNNDLSEYPSAIITGTNSHMGYNKNSFEFQNYEIRTQDNTISVVAKLNDSDFVFSKSEQEIRFKLQNLDHKIINKYFNSNALIDGRYNVKGYGTTDNIRGHVDFKNSTLKDMKFVNNIFAVINTIPSILTLSNAGFNNKGYLVERGDMDYSYSNDSLYLSNNDVKSKNFNVKGNDAIDLKDDIIDMNLTITFFKELVETQIQITGKLNNPIVKLF